MTRPAAAVLADTARLTPEQRAFRAAAGGRLALALPREVWLDHRHSVLPREVVGKPSAVRRPSGEGQRAEVWFDFLQVTRRGVDPRGKRRVLVVSGGTMANMGGRSKRR